MCIRDSLKTSQKQLLEISKALFFQAKLLILDEPTTSLNNDEVEHLFQIIRRLKEKGTAFVFISHKMPEIFRIADRYTVCLLYTSDAADEEDSGDLGGRPNIKKKKKRGKKKKKKTQKINKNKIKKE